ncbi:hypothetical protein [Streptantibioticus cattleyicolor]|uniref:Uncharacterized protein n=1 Tax=Streptantibioticus cattleyicolor (strain ATCC 35852 / DSM 46488 / JCM 4925 / NBRC 14057 / NRRL 8057) TaxID=1003195 RepID=F8JMZ2_STREN|nr:hypothetical protein [Streptantibioticus cattleyicolor]AEW98456.1 hypothetical protein SCATT_p02630 [Streptantibioticus cattleyicolor NRRL 8057 = DSM 46488]CCB72488.1 protein of unknown function [Streptantibioticus cattleyicolor NRRL 8057 = DSM 46488]
MTGVGTVSPEGLEVQVAHRRNPYAYLFDDAGLDALLLELGVRRAASVWRNHTTEEERAPRGRYPRPAMGFVLLDATAGPWVRNEEAVLAVITVGDGGHTFLPNAAAKAAAHRRLGRNNGEAVHVDPHLLATGDFRYGHSADVRGQIVAASSQSTDQDLYEAARLAADFVHAVGDRHADWERRRGAGDWAAPDDTPAPEHRAMTAWFQPS